MARLGKQLEPQRLAVVANKVREERELDAVRDLAASEGVEMAGAVPYDERLVETDWAATAPLDFDPGAPAVAAIDRLARRLIPATAVAAATTAGSSRPGGEPTPRRSRRPRARPVALRVRPGPCAVRGGGDERGPRAPHAAGLRPPGSTRTALGPDAVTALRRAGDKAPGGAAGRPGLEPDRIPNSSRHRSMSRSMSEMHRGQQHSGIVRAVLGQVRIVISGLLFSRRRTWKSQMLLALPLRDEEGRWSFFAPVFKRPAVRP